MEPVQALYVFDGVFFGVETQASCDYKILWKQDTLNLATKCWLACSILGTGAPSQYPKRRLFVISRKVSKPRDWYFKLSYRFEIWQQCYRCACQISERSDNSKYKSRGFETLRDLTERRLFGYWDGARVLSHNDSYCLAPNSSTTVPTRPSSPGQKSKSKCRALWDGGGLNIWF